MRRGILAAVVIGVAMLIHSGCAPKAFEPGNYANLKPGMTKAQVQDKMGKPTGTEIADAAEIWQYDRHDPISSRLERIELRFENGVYKDMKKSSLSD